MQIDCPTCRRVLSYSGERPLFCAYCGRPLEESGRPANVHSRNFGEAAVDTDPERTGPMPVRLLSETVEYESPATTKGIAAAEEFPAGSPDTA